MNSTAELEMPMGTQNTLKPSPEFTDDPISSLTDGIYAEWTTTHSEVDSTADASIVNMSISTITSPAETKQAPHAIPLRIVTLPTTRSSSNYHQLQRWEGRVDSVGTDSFTATISDLTNRSLPDESVDIDLDELGDSDRERVKPGALFIWSIAYEDAGSGRRTISEIRFRRFRKWDQQSLKAVKRTRALIDSIIGGE